MNGEHSRRSADADTVPEASARGEACSSATAFAELTPVQDNQPSEVREQNSVATDAAGGSEVVVPLLGDASAARLYMYKTDPAATNLWRRWPLVLLVLACLVVVSAQVVLAFRVRQEDLLGALLLAASAVPALLSSSGYVARRFKGHEPCIRDIVQVLMPITLAALMALAATLQLLLYIAVQACRGRFEEPHERAVLRAVLLGCGLLAAQATTDCLIIRTLRQMVRVLKAAADAQAGGGDAPTPVTD